MLLCGCKPDDHGITVNGRSNADVTITNENTGIVWHGESKGIEQITSIGETDDNSSFDIVAHEGDVLRVNYSPYSHFAKEHSVTMTVYFAGVETTVVTHAPYETKLTVGADVSKGIQRLNVIGTSGNNGDECYLNERRSVRVKVE